MTWTPPAAARRAAALALEVRATLPRSQRAGTPIGIARAVQLRDGRPISLDTARRMLAFFTRSARFEDAPRPSKAWQAWHLWGGTPARDALRMDPMICAPCVNPRDAQKYVRGMLDDLCARSNPPRSMPRTAEGARVMLAQAYDDAIGRARAAAFRADKTRTAAALEDAARYAYGLGMYGPAPTVPYDLLDRMRPPADPRQPDLFARANPAPPTLDDLRAVAVRGNRVLTLGAQRNAIADWLTAEGYRVTHDPHYTGSTYWIDDHNVDHTLQTSDEGDAILYVSDEHGPKRKIKGIATAAGLLAVARKFVRTNPPTRAASDADAARLDARRIIAEAYIRGVRTFRHRADDRTLTFSQPPNRGRGRVIVATYDAEGRALGRPSEHAEMSRSEAFDRAAERGFWLPVAAYEVPPPAPIAAPEVTATDPEVARLRQTIALVEQDRDRFKAEGKIPSLVYSNVRLRGLAEELRAAENRAIATERARASKPAAATKPPKAAKPAKPTAPPAPTPAPAPDFDADDSRAAVSRTVASIHEDRNDNTAALIYDEGGSSHDFSITRETTLSQLQERIDRTFALLGNTPAVRDGLRAVLRRRALTHGEFIGDPVLTVHWTPDGLLAAAIARHKSKSPIAPAAYDLAAAPARPYDLITLDQARSNVRQIDNQIAETRQYIERLQREQTRQSARPLIANLSARLDVLSVERDRASMNVARLEGMARSAEKAAAPAPAPARTPTPPPIAEDERDPARLSAGILAAQEAAAYYRQEAASADAADNLTRADLARADAETYEAEAQDLARRLAAATPAPAPSPVPPLVALGAQVEAAAARAEAAAIAADAVKGKRLRRAARAAADAAADEYADALRARDALSARMGDEWIEASRARARSKKPAPAPSKPAAPLRPVTGKAREVLARLGASVVSLGDVARVGCTDDPGARRIVAALTRSGAAMPAGPGAWSLDPSRLDECPPARPRTREPRPVCVGECGRWTPARAPSRAWLAALGPTSTIYDSEGRGYPVRWALARLDALGDGWHASNVGGRADPLYDRELQARERGSTASRAQVEKIAAALSLAQWVAPSSTPADSAPVVWIDPTGRGHVASGNGRTAAYALARPPRLAVAETVGGRWRIPKTLRAALEAADLVPIRIMGEAGEIDRAAAVLLAGASQASASGSLTQTERALSVVRALGLSVADMPALDWPEALTVPRLVAFGAANRSWASWALARLAPERAILLSSDPLALAVHYRDVMIGLLPPEAREGGIGGLSIDRALLGALPGIWTLETRIRDGRAPQSWSLVAVLPEARRWASRSAGRLKEIAADAASDARQEGLFGPARLDPEGAGLLAVALGGALARASGRMDPEAAGAEMVAALLDAAPDPSQPSLLGIDDADPVTVLARRARLSLGRSNPPGRDLARLSDAARRWHWGRYKKAKNARVDRAAWQPSQGFALGELAAISLGADRLEVPPGHLLCATDEGDAADLFVVPPLPLGSLAPRPLRAIEYLADKAGDGPSWYVHDFDPSYPQATTRGGALAIIRKGSRFSIDPARGIVG